MQENYRVDFAFFGLYPSSGLRHKKCHVHRRPHFNRVLAPFTPAKLQHIFKIATNMESDEPLFCGIEDERLL